MKIVTRYSVSFFESVQLGAGLWLGDFLSGGFAANIRVIRALVRTVLRSVLTLFPKRRTETQFAP